MASLWKWICLACLLLLVLIFPTDGALTARVSVEPPPPLLPGPGFCELLASVETTCSADPHCGPKAERRLRLRRDAKDMIHYVMQCSPILINFIFCEVLREALLFLKN